MKNEKAPDVFYTKQIEDLKAKLRMINQKRQRIAWQRLFTVLLCFFVVYGTWNVAAVWIIVAEIVIGLTVFLLIVSKDADAKNEMTNSQQLITINEKEINILNHNYQQYETGEAFLPDHHIYAEDLDIFGKASLYQYVNRCTTQQGKQLLASRLLYPLSKQQIESEQQAIEEIKNKTGFLQQLQAYGLANPLFLSTEKKINEWLQSPLLFTNKKWSWLAAFFPFFTIAFLFLYMIDIVPAGLFYLVLFGCYLFSFFISSKINSTYELLSHSARQTETLQKQLSLIENESFTSEKMLRLQQQLVSGLGSQTSAEIKKLYKVLNRFDIRLNHFAFFFLNTLFLWDLQQLLSLNKWRRQNSKNVASWFSVMAETEVSSSFGVLAFNKPGWCMPVVTNEFFRCNGENLGHPLLPEEKRVDNSFSLNGKGKIGIITGSNMGGKSTFLRSLGINIVLAFAGAPVCAESFSVTVVKLMSSMRIADNLAESTSTFYAELKKLKAIIKAVNNNENAFILLDEILRGTNSLDRHAGSVALLKQLIQKEAVALIATHDIELAKLELEYPKAIHNYHFDVQAEGSELYFDYKLKTGICRSMNASILMKNIGIELD